MLQIVHWNNRYTIQNGDEYLFTITLDEMHQLQEAIAATLENNISTAQALQIAQERGYTIPAQTLLSACKRGNIAQAHKQGFHWRIPKQSLDEWLAKRLPSAR